MSKSAILELYQKVQQDKLNSPEYTKVLRKFNNCREEFDKKLSEEHRQQLTSILQIRSDIEGVGTKDYFIEGFKLATRLMTEVYYKENT